MMGHSKKLIKPNTMKHASSGDQSTLQYLGSDNSPLYINNEISLSKNVCSYKDLTLLLTLLVVTRQL